MPSDQFDPDAYLKEKDSGSPGGFNPDSYLSAKTGESSGGKTDAFLAGVGDTPRTLSGGFLPSSASMNAFVQKYIPDPAADTDQKLRSQGIQINQADFNDYDTNLKNNQQRVANLKAQYPQDYAGGVVAESAPIAAAGLLAGGPPVYAAGKAVVNNPVVKYGLLPAAGVALGKDIDLEKLKRLLP